MSGRAVFLDRDGTLVQARRYLSRPEDLILSDGVASELRVLQGAGFRLILVTNQSGLARGYFTLEVLGHIHERLASMLADERVTLDAVYFCPHHVSGTVAKWSIDCDCRKPKPGMLLRAGADWGLDLPGSWFVGDTLDDVEAGNRAGCRTILVDLETEQAPEQPIRRPHFVARTPSHALQIIGAVEKLAPTTDLTYRPASWPAG